MRDRQQTAIITHPNDVKRILERSVEHGGSVDVGSYTGDWGLGAGVFTIAVNHLGIDYYDMAWMHWHHPNNPIGLSPHTLEVMQISGVSAVELRRLGEFLIEMANKTDTKQAK